MGAKKLKLCTVLGSPSKVLPVLGQYAYGPEGAVTPDIRAEQQAQAQFIEKQQRVEDEVAIEDLMRRGADTSMVQTGTAIQVNAATPPVTIVTYRVPDVYVLRLLEVGVTFNDPAFMAYQPALRLPWRLEINDVAAPNFGEGGGPMSIVPGDFFRPTDLHEFWVQGGLRVAVVIRPFTTTIEVNVAARLSGELYKKAGLKLGRRV